MSRERFLLVRLRQIGDVVFTTPSVKGLRDRFPDAHITYLVEPAAAPVVAQNEYIDEVRVVPRRSGLRGLLSDIAVGRRLRADHFDVAIDFHGGPRASLLTWLSGAPVRIGYEVAGRGWMYTRRVPRPRALRARHSVLNQWDLLEALGVSPPDAASNPVHMPVDAAARASTLRKIEAARIPRGEHLIVVHVSAGNPFRRWPIDSFAQLAAGLVRDHANRSVILTSGPSEEGAVRQVLERARALVSTPDEARRIADCGEFSLAELRALCDIGALYIGGDSGPLHIAATSAVPIVALYGPTPSERSRPWRGPAHQIESLELSGLPCRPCDQRSCVPGDFRCLTWIAPAQVLEAAERVLGATG